MFDETKPFFVMMVGLPGSGKSTYVEKLLEERADFDFVVASTDRIIEDMATKNDVTYNFIHETVPFDDINNVMFGVLKDAYNDRRNIILDRTNLTMNSRAFFIERVREEYNIVVVNCIETIDTILERNRIREDLGHKSIPEEVLFNMIGSYVEPEVWEGVNLITEIRSTNSSGI